MGQQERPEERDAAAIVAELHGAHTIFVGDKPGSHDYDLVLTGGSRGALEVTSCSDPERRQLTTEIGKVSDYEVIPVATLQYRWDVWLDEVTSHPKKTAMNGPRLLAYLEANGVNQIRETDRLADFSMQRLREECGIRSAVALTDYPGGIFILPPGGGTGDSKLSVNGALERAANLPDNKRKLSDANFAEHHLFIWFDMTEFDPWYAIDKRNLPTTAPVLPDEVTQAWAAGIPFFGGEAVVWLWDRARGWRIARDNRTEI